MNFTKKSVIFISLFWTFAVLQGCSRSSEYKREKDYYSSYPDSYYGEDSNKQGEVSEDQVEVIGQPKKKTAVFHFWNDTPLPMNELGRFASKELKRLLRQSNRVIIHETSEILKTKRYVDDKTVRVGQLVRKGRQLGVSAIVLGRISKLTFREEGDQVGLLRKKKSVAAARLQLKIFDISNGQEVASFTENGTAQSDALVMWNKDDISSEKYKKEMGKLAIRKALRQAAGSAAQGISKLSWQGKIVKVKHNRVYLNAGKKSGIAKGDILKVRSPGEELHDPDSGTYLGKTKGKLKGTLEVVGFAGDNSAIARLHSGGKFQVGDIVKLY